MAVGNATFNGIQIGDHAWLELKTDIEVEVHKIPRADGVITRRRGGGLKTLVVHAWITRNQRNEIEQYFDGLALAFTTAKADLIVNGKTYSDCLLKSITPDSDHNKWARFNVEFLKSG